MIGLDKTIARLDELQIHVDLSTDWERGLIILQYGSDPRYQQFPKILEEFEVIEQLTIRNSMWQELPPDLLEFENVVRIRLVLDEVESVDGLEKMSALMSVGLYLPKLTAIPENFGSLVNLKFLAIKAPLQDIQASVLDLENLKTLYLAGTAISRDHEIIKQLEENVKVRFVEFPVP